MPVDPAKRDANLALATEVYTAQAALRRRIKEGELAAADVLADPPEYALSMPLHRLLSAQPWWGPDKVKRFCGFCEISKYRKLGELTPRQRKVLIKTLWDRTDVAHPRKARRAARKWLKEPSGEAAAE